VTGTLLLEPKDDEKKLFYGCKAVMKELDKMLPE